MEEGIKYQQDLNRVRRPMTSQQAFMEHGKLPPQAIDVEELVLGGIMMDSEAFSTVVKLLTPDVFYKESHQIIYEACLGLYDKNQPIDIISVANYLKNSGQLDAIGGPYMITQLTSRIISSANIEFHVAILIQKHIARELIRVSTEIIRDSFEECDDTFELLDKADRNISKISESVSKSGYAKSIGDLADEALVKAREREIATQEGKLPGITTGIKKLNHLTGGWHNGDLIIFAGRPSMGKTAMMLHFAKSAAQTTIPVAIFSLEMTGISLANRMILSECNVSPHDFKHGTFHPEEWDDMMKAASKLKLPIYVDPNPVVSMRYIKTTCRILARKGKCGIVMIDYLQLADMTTGERNRNREYEVAQASRQAKILAKELDVPVILLSQLNRNAEGRKSGRPQLSDLRESGAIEQDADVVCFIYRPEYYGIDTDDSGNSTHGVGLLIVDKYREGALEDIPFAYNESMTKIKDHEPENPFNVIIP
jgi:replicative DNA helicase